MKNTLLLFFLAIFGQTRGQTSAPILPSAKILVQTAVGADPATLTCIVQDDLSRFDATSFAVGDSVYLIDGSDLLVYAVTSITSAAGNSLTIIVDDVNNTGIAAPTGQGAICEPTSVFHFPLYVSGLRDDLRSMMMNRAFQLIDTQIKNARPKITDARGLGVTPSPSSPSQGDWFFSTDILGNEKISAYDGAAWKTVIISGGGASYTAGAGISISAGVISNTGDADDDPANEIQTLNYTSAAGQVTISGGNTVTIPIVGNGDRGLFPSFASIEKVTASTSAQALALSTSPSKSFIFWEDFNGILTPIFKN